jgi:hypothetical protein
MPVPDKIYLSTPSDTSTSALGVTGELREHIHATYGKQYYRMVKNATGSSIAANVAVVFTSGSDVNCAVSGAAQPVAYMAGITQNIIPDGEYAWVCCGGSCKATSGSALSVNSLLSTVGAAGALEDTAISTIALSTAIVGVNTAVVGSATTFTVRLCNMM